MWASFAGVIVPRPVPAAVGLTMAAAVTGTHQHPRQTLADDSVMRLIAEGAAASAED
jgi:hypothetical protein